MPDPHITPDLERAWEDAQARILAAPAQRGRTWRFSTLRAALRPRLEEIQAEAATLAATFSPEAANLLATRSAEALLLLQAGTFCELQASRQSTRTRAITEIAARAEAARAIGMRNLGLLVGLGLFDPEQADAIRSGRGHADLAGDLAALSPLLRLQWAILEPLQAHHADPDQRLTLALIDAMPRLAEELLDTDTEARQVVGPLDWTDACRRAAPLLEDAWDQLRFMVAGGRAALGHLERAREVAPSLTALSRRR